MKNLLSVFIIVMCVACEQGAKSESSESQSEPKVEQTFTSEDLTPDNYGTYSTGCMVGGSTSSIADDVILTITIDATGVEIAEEIFVSGGLGCMSANKIVTLTHTGAGSIETHQNLDLSIQTNMNIEIDDTVFTTEHIVFDNYNCGGVIIDNVGDSEYLPANGCEYSRTGHIYELSFTEDGSGFNVQDKNGSNIFLLNTHTVDFN